MKSVAGQSCVPHRVAATFLHSTIDSKKKIRYTIPHLHNRFFDNCNSDSCSLSESSRMRLELLNSLNLIFNLYGEFDPGSERTLAAYLTHASRTRKETSVSEYSGVRVRNT